MVRGVVPSGGGSNRDSLARLLRETEAGILLNEHIATDGATVFARACWLGAEGIVSKKVDGADQSGRAASGSRSAIRQHRCAAGAK
jgi:hypothetical protein